jgi:type I restriction enzyme S subunit
MTQKQKVMHRSFRIAPSGWNFKPLGEIVSMRSGGTPPRGRVDFWNGDMPWFSGKDLKSPNLEDSIEHITKEALRSSKQTAPQGSLLILIRGMTLLKKVPVGLLLRDASFNQDIRALIPNKEIVHPKFLLCALLANNERLQDLVTIAGHGTGRLATDKLADFGVPVPPLPEQKAIAAVLQCWDRGIQNLEAKLAAKERVKKGLMQQLLSGRIRMPGFSKEGCIEDGEWQMPDGWKAIPLGELGSFSKGVGLSKAELTVEGLPCLRYGEIYTTTDFILNRFRSFIPKAVAAVSKRIKYNDLLFAGSGETAGEIGKCLAYLRKNEEAYAGGDIVILSVNAEIAKADYLSYFLNTIGRKQLNRLGQGQSMVHLYSKDLSRVDIPLPPLEEQKAIVEVLSAADREIDALRRKLGFWKVQKQYLLNHLVDGTIRLPQFVEPETEVAG